MPTLRTRAGKGSDLTPGEADANFKRTVTQKTTTYACLVGDNNGVIEGLHATTAFTITLGDAATMIAAETGSYVVTITNIGAAVVTVARAGSDTINGAATSLTLNQYSTVTLQVVSAGDGYETIARTGDIGAVNTGAITTTGNIAVSGTVDGRDVAADGTKLDGIYHGRISSSGTVVSGGSGFTVTKVAVGDYKLTHTLGHNNYTIVTNASANAYFSKSVIGTVNDARIGLFSDTSTAVDGDVNFILILD